MGVAGNRVLVRWAVSWAVDLSLGEREPLHALEEGGEVMAVEPGEGYPVSVCGVGSNWEKHGELGQGAGSKG